MLLSALYFAYLNAAMKPIRKDMHGINIAKIHITIPAHFIILTFINFPISMSIIPADKTLIKLFKKSTN